MQIFQEKRKKTWFSTRYLANFQKIFMPNCSPSIFTYTPMFLFRNPKKKFSDFFQENSRNQLEIIF